MEKLYFSIGFFHFYFAIIRPEKGKGPWPKAGKPAIPEKTAPPYSSETVKKGGNRSIGESAPAGVMKRERR